MMARQSGTFLFLVSLALLSSGMRQHVVGSRARGEAEGSVDLDEEDVQHGVAMVEEHAQEQGPTFNARDVRNAVEVLADLAESPPGACSSAMKSGLGLDILDLRGCWGELREADSGELVCGKRALYNLAAELRAMTAAKFDSAGQGGATIVMNLKGFIVKNVVDDKEYEVIQRVMPEIGRDIGSRHGRCFSTALAPTCAVVLDKQGTRWLLMRKIELHPWLDSEEAREAERESIAPPNPKEGASDGGIKWLDLKGPHFASDFSDGKTQMNERLGWFGSDDMWRHKDIGFVKTFPDGMELSMCGSRDASYSMVMDEAVLAKNTLTDYSAFGAFYKTTEGQACVCQKGYPVFPVVLDVPAKGTQPRFRVALGIIDYFETKVANWLKRGLSTMKKPEKYRTLFSEMWPSYFHPPALELVAGQTPDKFDVYEKGNNERGESSSSIVESFHTNQRVVALLKMKWSSTSVLLDSTHTSISEKYYTEQISPGTGGSSQKVTAGHFGFIRGIHGGGSHDGGRKDFQVKVEWEGISSKTAGRKVFSVRGDQITAA